MQGNVYMLVGAGGNIAVQIGDEGVLVVDTGIAQMSDKVLAAIRKLSDKPIRYIVNTHFHPDHTGGNEAIAKAGSTTRGGGRRDPRARKRAQPDERAGRQAARRRHRRVADRHVLPGGEGHLLQRRSR